MDWSESGYLALSALNVKDGYIDFSQDVHYGNQELYDKWMSGKELHRGQVLFTTEAPMGNVAQVPDNKGYILSQRTIAFDVEEKILSENFLATLLRTPNVFNDLTALSSGGTAKGVSQKSLSGLDVVIPKNIDEQNKLADYFINLDNLITLHQRKYLQEKKTSLTWEQCKLEDVMDTVTDYVAAGSFEDIRNNVTYLNEPGYAQLVRTVDLKKKFTNNDSVYVDESAFKYLWRVNLNDECIVLPNIGANIGEVYFVEPSGLPYDNNVLGPNAILLKANEDTYFAFTALNNLTFQKQLFENVGSSGQPKFNKTKLKSIQLYMPQNEEQVKIGQYFRQLDHLITLHRRAHFHRRRRTYK